MTSKEILPCPKCGRLPKYKFKHSLYAGYTCIYYCKSIFNGQHFEVAGFDRHSQSCAEQNAVELWNQKVISYQKEQIKTKMLVIDL